MEEKSTATLRTAMATYCRDPPTRRTAGECWGCAYRRGDSDLTPRRGTWCSRCRKEMDL